MLSASGGAAPASVARAVKGTAKLFDCVCSFRLDCVKDLFVPSQICWSIELEHFLGLNETLRGGQLECDAFKAFNSGNVVPR